MEWETVIGLEIHAQLRTKSKIFSSALAVIEYPIIVNIKNKNLYKLLYFAFILKPYLLFNFCICISLSTLEETKLEISPPKVKISFTNLEDINC